MTKPSNNICQLLSTASIFLGVLGVVIAILQDKNACSCK